MGIPGGIFPVGKSAPVVSAADLPAVSVCACPCRHRRDRGHPSPGIFLHAEDEPSCHGAGGAAGSRGRADPGWKLK